MSHLNKLVNLFRLLDKPDIDGQFTFRVSNFKLTEIITEALIDIWTDKSFSAGIIELIIGTKSYQNGSEIQVLKENTNENCRVITVYLPRTGKEQFYLNLSDFIERYTDLDIGRLPSNFYLVKEDYFHGGTQAHEKPKQVHLVEHFCEFIKLIVKTAHFTDSESGNAYKAVFVVTDENNRSSLPKTVSLEFTQQLLSMEQLDLSILKEITSDKVSSHNQEKLSTLTARS